MRLPEYDTVPRYLDIIPSASDLLEFSYHHHSVVPQSPGPYHPQIVHKSLQTLSASLGALLCNLVLPALKQMNLASVKSEKDLMVCPRDALFHLHDLALRSHTPIIPQLVSLSSQEKKSSKESDATMESLFIAMTETVRVGNILYHMLLPCLKYLEFVLDDVEFDRVNYLDVDFVQMIVSRRTPLGSQLIDFLRIVVAGRAFEVQISDNGGLEELKRLGDNGLNLQLDLADWDERVLQASALPRKPDDD